MSTRDERQQSRKFKCEGYTIVAPATPPGKGGIGIVRVSGSLVPLVAQTVLNVLPKPRQATYAPFIDENRVALDEGIALFFPKPHSFTGEDVLELQGHGGPMVLDLLIQRILKIHSDIRLARPGEFSERAFLNGKLDLTQAEAIADLIEASTAQATKFAMRSLQGAFSEKIQGLLEQLTQLRTFIEAAIDFPEEEIDFLNQPAIGTQLDQLLNTCQLCLKATEQGVILKEGLTIVLTGRPNAGKSSLLNALTGTNTAIVTPFPGTTRDVLKEQIHMDGIPLHVVDTAGIRDDPDVIEQEGIRRAWQEIDKANHILLIVDGTTTPSIDPFEIDRSFMEKLKCLKNLSLIRNKSDLTGEPIGIQQEAKVSVITLSAKTGEGIDLLKQHLKESCGVNQTGESGFGARRRHLEALKETEKSLQKAKELWTDHLAGELIAEELKLAQQFLSEITGSFTTEDLLSKIFSTFCIGK